MKTKAICIIVLLLAGLLISMAPINVFAKTVYLPGFFSASGSDWRCYCPLLEGDCWCKFIIPLP